LGNHLTKKQNIFQGMTAKGQSLEMERRKKKKQRGRGEGKGKAFIFPLYFVIKEILWLLQVTH
jgi:hypothetical protein